MVGHLAVHDQSEKLKKCTLMLHYQPHKDVAKRAREREADKTKTVAAKRQRVT